MKEYDQVINYLYDHLPYFQRTGPAAYKNNLDNTLSLDKMFGHPHREFHSVHVAGTNGKGSVSHILASVLQEAGYKTGLYTSPHLKDFRERIRVNGQPVSKDFVVRFVDEFITKGEFKKAYIGIQGIDVEQYKAYFQDQTDLNRAPKWDDAQVIYVQQTKLQLSLSQAKFSPSSQAAR